MSTILRVLFMLLVVIIPLAASIVGCDSRAPLSVSVQFEEVTLYYPDKCYNGYTLYEIRGIVNLIDMDGYVAHTWRIHPEEIDGVFKPRLGRELLTNGNLIVLEGDRKLVEYDWDGNIVWSYQSKDKLHHDYYVTAAGNILMLCQEIVPEEYKANIKDEERRNKETIFSDYIIEVTPQGQIVWEWHEYEHLDINRYCPLCALEDWTYTNTVQELPETTLGTQDSRFRAGNILINPRNLSTFYGAAPRHGIHSRDPAQRPLYPALWG